MKNLNKRMCELLRISLEVNRPDLICVLSNDEALNNSDIVNELRDAVGTELINKGFNNNDEPNSLGLELEELIDILGRLILKR